MSKIDNYREAKQEHEKLVAQLTDVISGEGRIGQRYNPELKLIFPDVSTWLNHRTNDLFFTLAYKKDNPIWPQIIAKSAEMLEQSHKEAEEEAINFIKGVDTNDTNK